MKRWLPLFVMLLLLLTGCTGNPEGSAVFTPTPVNALLSAPKLEMPEVRYHLLKNARPLEDDTLSLVPLEALGELEYPNLLAFDGKLLLYAHKYYESERSELTLLSVDWKNGAVLSRATYETQGYTEPQVRGDRLYLCDSSSGQVLCLDSELQMAAEYALEPDWMSWYPNSTGDQIYRVDWFSGVTQVNLASGATKDLLQQLIDPHCPGCDEDSIYLNYIDPETLLNVSGRISLDSGALEEAPFDIYLSALTCWEGRWLGTENWTNYYYGTAEDTYVFQPDDGQELYQLTPTGHLLMIDNDSKQLTLYDANGNYLSQCTLSVDEHIYLTADLIWNEIYGGYFFSLPNNDGYQFLFWDISAAGGGDDLPMVSLEEYETICPGTAVDSALYERAAQLSRDYGIDIRIADQCETEFSDFETYQLYDEDAIINSLDILESVLTNYPEGFIDQLRYGTIRTIEISLVGELTAREGYGIGSYAAFTQPVGDTYLMVMDSYMVSASNYYHEFSHIIDNTLGWRAQYDDDCHFSEESWRALSPEDADYSYTYNEWPSTWDNGLDAYFVDSYSRTYPTEDRARIMEYAMDDMTWVFEEHPAIKEKLRYYSECIRDGFDTTGWPEITCWERPLEE